MALLLESTLFPGSTAITLGPANPNGQVTVSSIWDTSGWDPPPGAVSRGGMSLFLTSDLPLCLLPQLWSSPKSTGTKSQFDESRDREAGRQESRESLEHPWACPHARLAQGAGLAALSPTRPHPPLPPGGGRCVCP